MHVNAYAECSKLCFLQETVPFLTSGTMPFPTFPLLPSCVFYKRLCSSACSYIQADVIGFAASKIAKATFAWIVSSYLHIPKLLETKVKRAEGNKFSFITEDLQKSMLSFDSNWVLLQFSYPLQAI